MSDVIYLDAKDYSVLLSTVALCRELRFLDIDVSAGVFKTAFLKALEASKNLAKFFDTELKNVPFRVQMPFNRSFFDIANSVKRFECEGCNEATTELVEYLNSLSRLIHFEGMRLDYLDCLE